MLSLKDIPDLAGRLKYIREKEGLSQEDLARICGTTQQAIQQAEAGKARNPRYLHKLALALGIPFEWLTMNVGANKKPPTTKASGFSDRQREVVDTFFSMPAKDQALLLELMKTRRKDK